MQLQLDLDTQDVLISLERIDTDYKRVSDEQSKQIVSFIDGIVHLLSPRVLWVFVMDIETERERYERCKKLFNEEVHGKTIYNWTELERKIVQILDEQYAMKCTLNGLYTTYTDTDPSLLSTYKYDKTIELTDEEFDKLLLASFEYAFGRHTYVVSSTVNYLTKFKDKLHQDTIDHIVNRIREEQNRISTENETNSWYPLDVHDIKEWSKLIDVFNN